MRKHLLAVNDALLELFNLTSQCGAAIFQGGYRVLIGFEAECRHAAKVGRRRSNRLWRLRHNTGNVRHKCPSVRDKISSRICLFDSITYFIGPRAHT
jgi:hypothetical protein